MPRSLICLVLLLATSISAAAEELYVKTYEIKHANAQTLSRILNDVWRVDYERFVQSSFLAAQLQLSAEQWPKTVTLATSTYISDMLVVRASEAQHEQVRAVLEVTDRPANLTLEVMVLHSKHADARQLAVVLAAVLGSRGSVATFASTSSLIVSCRPEHTSGIVTLFGYLDAEVPEANAVTLHEIANANASELAALVDRILGNRRG
jgi:type II secretory pathway component GspD/PulD (secretin)